MHHVLFAFLFLWGCSAPSVPLRSTPAQVTASPREVALKHIDADIALHTTPGSTSLTSTATLSFMLHRCARLEIDAVAFDLSAVELNPPGRWSYDGENLSVSWAAPISGPAQIKIFYDATPGKGVTTTPDAVWTSFHTWHWLPVLRDPSQRATLDLKITAPPGWTTLATGDGPDRPGPDVASTVPHPSYTYGFFAGALRHHQRQTEDGVFDVWAPPGAPVEVALQRSVEAARRWNQALSRPFDIGHYVQIFVPGDTKQELAGMAFLPAGYLDTLSANPEEDWLIVHELAHQGWGNRVTCATWGDFWLNEAVVVWWVAHDKALRGDVEGHGREIELWRKRTERALKRGDDARIYRPGVDVGRAGGSIVYNAGALVIHEITEVVGVYHLEATLSRLLSTAPGGRALSTDALLDALELGVDRPRILNMLEDAASR